MMIYPINLYRELRTWWRVRKVALEYEDQLSSMGFRVDWIGRIYTVINLPEEVITAAPQIQEGYVLMKLRDYDRLFLQLGLAGDVFPEMERIEEDGVAAFLLILSPDRDYFTFWSLAGFLIKTSILVILVRFLWVLGTNNLDLILSILEGIKNYLA
jgi:hypothetical protein